MKLLITPSCLWKSIALNFVIKLLPLKDLTTRIVYNSIYVIMDKFIKYTYMVPVLRTQDALIITKVFFQIIFMNYGILDEVILNKDKLFILKFWKTFIALLEIK